MNKIEYADELRQAAYSAHPGDMNAWHNAAAQIHTTIRADYPVYVGIVDAVVYNDKTDRYVMKFNNSKSSAKVTNEVAEFLLAHVFPNGSPLAATTGGRPTVSAAMKDGTVEAVHLLFLSRA
jgi:hypothetical protein